MVESWVLPAERQNPLISVLPFRVNGVCQVLTETKARRERMGL